MVLFPWSFQSDSQPPSQNPVSVSSAFLNCPEVFSLKRHQIKLRIHPPALCLQRSFNKELEKDSSFVNGKLRRFWASRNGLLQNSKLGLLERPLTTHFAQPIHRVPFIFYIWFWYLVYWGLYQRPKEAIMTAQIWSGVWHLKATVPFFAWAQRGNTFIKGTGLDRSWCLDFR